MGYQGVPSIDASTFVGDIPLGAMASTDDFHAPSQATAAVLTFPAPGADQGTRLAGLIWSYSAAPTGGNLTITEGGVTVFNLDITAAGVDRVQFIPPKAFGNNTAVVCTLASGAGTVVGKLNSLGHWSDRYGGMRYAAGGTNPMLDFSRSDNSQELLLVAL